jgi:hypothetical protein
VDKSLGWQEEMDSRRNNQRRSRLCETSKSWRAADVADELAVICRAKKISRVAMKQPESNSREIDLIVLASRAGTVGCFQLAKYVGTRRAIGLLGLVDRCRTGDWG